ncbi:MAG: DUF4430 domain-containing protein [Clostridia bacterium]|nr:DUF4430 domain-containing protein [Clostridia bacterium]
MRHETNQQLHNHRKALLSCFLALVLLLSIVVGSFTLFAQPNSVDQRIDALLSSQNLPDILNSATEPSGNLDWLAFGYATVHSGKDLSAYALLLSEYVESTAALTDGKATDNCRMALVLSAVAPEENSDYIAGVLASHAGKGNLYTYIYGLLLADSRNYTCSGREDMLAYLLNQQLEDGGWSMTGKMPSDVDTTALALTSLAKYKDRSTVAPAIEGALNLLKSKRQSNGSFANFFGQANSESTAQVIIALCSLDIDPKTYFESDGYPDVISAFYAYAKENGSFSHLAGGEENAIATYQALHALSAYASFTKGAGSIFDFESPELQETETGTETESAKESDTQPAETQTETLKNSETETDKESESESEAGSSESGQESSTESLHEPESESERDRESDSETDPDRDSDTETVFEPGTETVRDSDTVSTTESETHSGSSKGSQPVWKWVLVGGVGLLGALSVLILFLTHHANLKRILPILLITAAAVTAIILFVNIESVDQHFAPSQAETDGSATETAQTDPGSESQPKTKSVTIEIRCYNALPYNLLIDLPEDGIILPRTTVEITDSTSVWDVLDTATRRAGILTIHRGSKTGAYVEAIAGLHEMDCGDLSGWVYVVNGIQPSTGCGSYICQDGDEIYWVYSCSLGTDVLEGEYDWN